MNWVVVSNLIKCVTERDAIRGVIKGGMMTVVANNGHPTSTLRNLGAVPADLGPPSDWALG